VLRFWNEENQKVIEEKKEEIKELTLPSCAELAEDILNIDKDDFNVVKKARVISFAQKKYVPKKY
jgi:hypothetical protein